MSTATAIRVTPMPTAPVDRSRVRPVRRTGPVRESLGRPGRAVPAPRPRPDRRTLVRACQVGPATGTETWRLTDRGIVVVLVLAAMIVVAAMTVIGLTAWQVTGPDYRAGLTTAISSA